MSKSGGKVRIAVVGAGLIGERHARLLCSLEWIELYGIADPSEHSTVLAEQLRTPTMRI